MEEVRENKMGTQPIGDLLFKMSLPIMISMLVQALYNIVDSIFVAKISEDALTAVSLAFPVQNLMIALGAGTGVGINALLSKSLGEKNFKQANSAANNGIFLCLVNFAIFVVFGAFFTEIFYRSQTSSKIIIEYGDFVFHAPLWKRAAKQVTRQTQSTTMAIQTPMAPMPIRTPMI